MRFLSDILVEAGLVVDGVAQFNTVANASVDTDKFLVIDGGVLKYRTGAQMLSDIGANNGTVTSVAMTVPTGLQIGGSPITTSGTLALAFQSGYSIPTNVKQSNWDDAYTWVSAFPTQTGNGGKYLTTDGNTLSWATVTAGISGSGTTNYLTKWTGASSIGNSSVFDNGTNVGVGTATPNATYKLEVNNGLLISAPYGALSSDYQTGALKLPQLVIEAANRDNLSARVSIAAGGWHTSTWFGSGAMANWTNTGGGAATQNSAFGINALGLNTSGNNNDAFGGFTLGQLTTGVEDTAFGRSALGLLQTGSYNTSVGLVSLYDLTTGSFNTAIGNRTGRGITTGNYNTIIGARVAGLSATLSNHVIIADGQANMRIVSFNDGNVYIGGSTTLPANSGYKLEVAGTGLYTGALTLSNLSGSGTRMVVADSSGVLSTQAISTGTVTGSGTTNYLPKWTGSTALGNSLVFDDGTSVGIGTASPTFTVGTGIQVYGSSYSTVKVNSGAYTGGLELTFGGVGEAYLYQRSNGFLQFGTNNSDRMRITASGRVLIGTTTESTYLLDVNGTARVTSGVEINTSASTTVTPLTVTTNTTSGWGIQVKHPTTYNTYSLLTDTSLVFADSTLGQSILTASTTRIVLRTGTSNTIAFGIGGSTLDERLRISSSLISINANQHDTDTRISGDNETNLFYADASVDRIGIGTSTPIARLSNTSTQITDGGTGTGSSGIQWTISDGGYHSAFYNTNVATNAHGLLIKADGGNPLLVQGASNAWRLAVMNTGNVLIGTTTDAGYKLDVNGTARSTAFYSDTYRTYATTAGGTITFITGSNTRATLTDLSGGIFNVNGNITNTGQIQPGTRILLAGGANIISNYQDAIIIRNGPNSSSLSTLVLDDADGTSASGYQIQRWKTGGVTKAMLDRDGNFVTLSSGYFGSISSVNSSAVLQADSTTKGLLPPRMTSTQRAAITTPAVGLVVYQTDGSEGLYENTSTGWRIVNAAGAGSGVTGTGTTNYLSKWTSSTALGNSLLSDISNVLTYESSGANAGLVVKSPSGYYYPSITLTSNGTSNVVITGYLTNMYAEATGGIRLNGNGTGNVMIGTNTDSGYKLDVNGTARFVNEVAAGGATVAGVNLSLGSGIAANASMRIYGGAGGTRYFSISHTTSEAIIDWTNNTGGVGTRGLILQSGAASLTIANAKFSTVGFVVATNSTNPSMDASAIIQADSDRKGFLPPRMTETQKNAISTPATGLIIYQTDGVSGLYVYTGSAWKALAIVS